MNIKLDIPEKFFEGEELCGYYISPEMKKFWAVQLDLLAEFSSICEKHNLKWWMDAGTLLGAARHKGFIPWDHDVDVIMMREDYERLLAVSAGEFTYPYTLIHFENSFMNVTFSQLCNDATTMLMPTERWAIMQGFPLKISGGISLDVFPVDNLLDNKDEIIKVVNELRSLSWKGTRIAYLKELYFPSKSPIKRPLKAIAHAVMKYINLDSKKFIRKYAEICKTCGKPDSKFVGKLCMADHQMKPASEFMKRRVWQRSDFQDTVYLPFEMLTLPAPSGWENILSTFYGNWHEFVIRKINGVTESEAFFYDTEHPYTYYTQEGHMPE